MQKQSFIKHVLQKINRHCTIFTKALLLILIVSMFLPFPNVPINKSDTIQTAFALYLFSITIIGAYTTFALFASYIQFKSISMVKLVIVLILLPILSLASYVLTSFFIPFNIIICVPSLAIVAMYTVEKLDNVLDNVEVDFTTKFKKIFFKK
jgi:hypothetical protein